MSERLLVDTGIWIALFDETDQHHGFAMEYRDWIEDFDLVVPWPTVYETLRTRFVKRRDRVAGLRRLLRKTTTEVLDDGPWRDAAYEHCLQYSIERNRPISLVDVLCRLIVEDPDVRLDCVLTANVPDFADVCRRRRVELLCP